MQKEKKSSEEKEVEIIDSPPEEVDKDLAQKNHEEILQLKNVMAGSGLLLGKAFKENKESLFYKVLGYRTFEAYIASPELSLHRSTVYKFMRVYEGFIEKLGVEHNDIKDIDADKLQLVLPVCTKTNVKSWIEKARNLSRSDLREEVQGKKQINQVVEGKDWMEFSDVWEKNQPVSRWGDTPHETIYGQFAANLMKYYTKPSDKVVYRGMGTVVEDVAEELLRKYENIDEGTDIINMKNIDAELLITYSDDIEQFYENTRAMIEMFNRSIKVDGIVAVYFKDKEVEESRYFEIINAIKSDSNNKYEIEKQIIVREKPAVDEANRAIRDNKMHSSYERILVFRKVK